MRIGFNGRQLVDPHTRGLTRYTVNLLRGLSADPAIELVVFCDQEPARGHFEGISAGVEVVRASGETTWEAMALPAALRRRRIDVFHAPADRGLPLVKPCPCVVTVHDSYERTHWRALFPELRQRYWYWKNELVNRLNADVVLTVSDTTRRMLAQLGVVAPARLRRTYLAPAAEFTARPEPADSDVLRAHGIAQPFILYVGGYDLRKNVDALVQAFDATHLSGHQLVVAARQHGRFAELERPWRGLGCFPRLRLIEASDPQLPALYRQAEFFVNPSLWESFSFQVVEAMACGTPLLASNRTAIPEIAGDAADYCDPADVPALARAMGALALDLARRRELQRRGFARAAMFSWQKTAAETRAVYEQLQRR